MVGQVGCPRALHSHLALALVLVLVLVLLVLRLLVLGLVLLGVLPGAQGVQAAPFVRGVLFWPTVQLEEEVAELNPR